MKAKQLIDLLSKIDPECEVVLWNGMVGDWVDIDEKLVHASLVRQSLTDRIECIANEERRHRKDWDYELPPDEQAEITELWKKSDWECNEFVTQEDIEEGRYLEKPVVYINAKKRGVSTWDRLGNIHY
jgi:hypothetical protein